MNEVKQNIKILNIKFLYDISYWCDEEQTEVLTGLYINFNYKRLKDCNTKIITNKELSIEEIKDKVASYVVD